MIGFRTYEAMSERTKSESVSDEDGAGMIGNNGGSDGNVGGLVDGDGEPGNQGMTRTTKNIRRWC